MSASLPPSLVRAVHPALLVALAVVAAGLGVADARFLMASDPLQRADLAFKLAALPALPLPALFLGLLTTPRHAMLRRMLGESAPAMLDRAARDAAQWTAVALAVPVGMVLASAGLGDVLRAAALAAMAILLAGGLGVALLLAALRAVAAATLPHARGGHLWQALAGGGAFGPAEATPLLYAPAFAFVAAIVPSALLSAVWGAAPDLMPVRMLAVLVAVAAAVAVGLARAQIRASRAMLQDALLAVEQAHATAFAGAQLLPEPPVWLTLGQPDAATRLLARAWVRRWPGSALNSVALVVLALWLAHAPGPLQAALLAGAIAFYGAVRVLGIVADPVYAAARWLGVADAGQRNALMRLAAGLCVPSLAVVALVLRGAPWPFVLAGLAAGAVGGLLLVRAVPERAWLPRVAMLLVGGALAYATAGS